jgi:hypothetical protein
MDMEEEREAYLEEQGREHEYSLEACIICDEPKQVGIRICMQFICQECEAEMVRTDTHDVRYPYFINQMKRIWYKETS